MILHVSSAGKIIRVKCAAVPHIVREEPGALHQKKGWYLEVLFLVLQVTPSQVEHVD